MKPSTAILGAPVALALCAASAWASNPDTDSRASATASTSGSTTVCEGGTNPGAPCAFSGDCTGGGTCTGIANVRVAARGVLTIIADTKPLGIGWASTALPGTCTNPDKSTGSVGSCETKDNALLALLLEFTLNGKKYTFAETFSRLPDGQACTSAFDCDFLVANWSIGGGSQAGWNQPAVESTIAERSLFSGQVVKLRWGGLPPAAESAVGAVLGKTATQRIALSRTDDVPICTDTIPCKLSATNPRFSDHSDGTDPLATVRRYKVDIAVIGP